MVAYRVRWKNEDGMEEEREWLEKGSFLEGKRTSLAVEGDKSGLYFPGGEETKL